MFDQAITILFGIKSLVYYTLVASLYVGKTLFELITLTVIKSSGLCSNVLAAIQILLEDFVLFLRDLSEHAGFGLRLVCKSIEYIFGAFTFIYSPFATTLQLYFHWIGAFFEWLSNFYNNTTALVTFLLANTKKLLILFGSGVWFAITIVPVAIFSGCLLLAYYVRMLFEEVKIFNENLWRATVAGVKNVLEFFWDVPFEALLGLAFLACIVFVCGKYILHIRRELMRSMRHLRSLFTFRISLPMKMKKVQKKTPVKSPNKSNAEEQGSCVVCQTKPKNILILPCKHLCTCEDCLDQIKRYSGRCPLCRTYIDRSILVYV